MGVNNNRPHLWKADISQSVDMYNDWFKFFAPTAFRETRIKTTEAVAATLKITNNLIDISPAILRSNPEILPTLRMSTCPPIAVDRLIGLAGVSGNLVNSMEKGKLPLRMNQTVLNADLIKIATVIQTMADPDIFIWLGREEPPTEVELYRAATIVADRLCGAVANPIIRNAQEKRQLTQIKTWLEARGYEQLPLGGKTTFNFIPPGNFSFRMNVPVQQPNAQKTLNIPIDVVITPKTSSNDQLPLLVEAKSAGDFTNVNKRRKEEATKMNQLKQTYGDDIKFCLFLCGYFDSGYLGYEAAEGIDWVWEHRIDDLAEFGL